jgi:hypothetical protein
LATKIDVYVITGVWQPITEKKHFLRPPSYLAFGLVTKLRKIRSKYITENITVKKYRKKHFLRPPSYLGFGLLTKLRKITSKYNKKVNITVKKTLLNMNIITPKKKTLFAPAFLVRFWSCNKTSKNMIIEK